jgi:hypothetical protein
MHLLGADHIGNIFHCIVATFLRGLFTDRRIETAVLLLLELLRNLATDCLPRICLCGNLFTNLLPGDALTCHNI